MQRIRLISDRFFSEAQESDSGHLFLATGQLTEFIQRIFSGDAGTLGITWPVPKTIQVYGEIVHETIFRILGVSPLGRQSAAAAPLWDLFTAEPDFTPYVREPRGYPEEINGADTPGAAASMRMAFRSAGRNPDLGRLLGLCRAWRMGKISRAEAERRLAEPMDSDEYLELLEEAVDETTAWERDFNRYQRWLAERGETILPNGLVVPLPPER